MPPFKKVLQRADSRLRAAGLSLSTGPTNFVVISNGGIMNNIRRSELEKFISNEKVNPETDVVEIILPRKKSYAFCHLRDSTVAENLVQSTQSKESFIQGNR